LTDGSVLLVGGINGGVTLSSTDSYQPSGLALPQLASITIAPSNQPMVLGTTLLLTATGADAYGDNLGMLQSVIWNSSSPSVATISNAAGSAGIVNSLAVGTTTITASVGTISTSTQVTVTAPLASITLSPSSPTVSLNSPQELQLTATGVYSNGNTTDLTAYVSWSTSNSSVATVIPNPAVPGIVAPLAVGTANITATYGSVNGSTPVTVVAQTVPTPPSITNVSPTAGTAGTQVTVAGSGFGSPQGNGIILLGSALGTVVSWNNNQVIATVNTGSSSGVAQIQQNGLSSNSIAFTVDTALISNVSPAGGLPGTQVTITGSGFGATQGSGMVWLGTAVGVVTNWSDGQVAATVAAGSTSGNAQILQNGVWSNALPFPIDSLQIANVTPNSGAAGTVVTITGGGFGNSQGSGSVSFGGAAASIVGWSDAQVMASVPSNAVTGVVKVEQNEVWSNAVGFTVPPTLGGEPQLMLVPTVISMVVGDTRSIQAWNSTSQQPVSGLTWTSSNTAIITLSTDDPPIITAVAVGAATITAGSASANVTVYPGPTLPTGTQIWSNLGDGSGVSKIMPAVPSSTGVADVFALQRSGNVQAIRSDGTLGWTADVSTATSLTPDFLGGLVVTNMNASPATVQELNGMTGTANQPYPYISPNSPPILVHTDGTIFTVDNNAIVGINPSTGQQSFTPVPLEMSVNSANGECGEYTPYQNSGPATVGQPIIAGDGYAYFPYVYTLQPLASNTASCTPSSSTYAEHFETHSRIMRVGSDGSALSIAVGDWVYDQTIVQGNGCGACTASSGSFPGNVLGTLITNADQGVLYSWAACPYTAISINCTAQFQLTTVTNGSPSTVTTNMGYQPGLSYQGIVPVQPILQRADGSYIGTVLSPQIGNTMVAFTASAQRLWNGPNDSPQIATADNGVIGASGTTYDQNGNVDGLIANMPTQSWLGYAYQLGPINQVSFEPTDDALSFWSSIGGNPSVVNPVAVKVQRARVFIPYGLYNQPTVPCTDTGTLISCVVSAPVIDPQDSQFRTEAIQAVPPWKTVMDIRIPASGNATVDNYLTFATASPTGTIKRTDSIVAYIGHGIAQPNSPQNGSYGSISMGLVFPASQCLWFYNLQPAPVVIPLQPPWVFACQNEAVNSVTQKPRIIFLGICGFTNQMLNDWTVDTNTQVIIYPSYNSSDTPKELQLGLAGNEFMTFIQSLVNGATVETALAEMNAQTQTDISQGHQQKTLAPTWGWTWTSYGNKNLTFTAP
jgi:hypothetical protein